MGETAVRQKAISLFEFLKEMSLLNRKGDGDSFDEILWASEIPRVSGTYFIGWQNVKINPDVWMEVRRPQFEPPPVVPSGLESFFPLDKLSRSNFPPPAFDGPPHLKPQWDQYVANLWTPWSVKDKELKSIEKIYKYLFYIYQQEKKLGEALETTLSIGYLTWRLPGGAEIKKHLINVKASISFDSNQGLLMVGPANAKPILDQSAIDVAHRPSREIEESIEHSIEKLGNEVWSAELLNTILKTWVQAAHPDGQYNPELERQSDISQTPIVHLAPALILRRLSARDLVRFYDEIKSRYENGAEIPLGVQRLVSVVDDKSNVAWNGKLFFPLSSNSEQRQIADRLENRQGVLVQGPPGTGKSHTIANLICHLLATGKRVLVTSHTPRALKVLRSKLPTSLSALCVDLLGDDLEAMNSLEFAVQGITKSAAGWREEESTKCQMELENALDNLKKEEAQLLAEIAEFYRAEKTAHTMGSYSGTLVEIAERLRKEETSLGWIQDSISKDNPLSLEEASRLLRFLRTMSVTATRDLEKDFIKDSIPEPSEFRGHIFEEEQLKKRESGANPFSQIQIPDEDRESLIEHMRSTLSAYDYLTKNRPDWTRKMADDILKGLQNVWEALFDTTLKHISRLRSASASVCDFEVIGAQGRQISLLREEAAALLLHLNSGGGFGFGPFRKRAVKEASYILEHVRVNGKSAHEPKVISQFIEWLEIVESLEKLDDAWRAVSELEVGSLNHRKAAYEDRLEPCEVAIKFLDQLRLLKSRLSTIEVCRGIRWTDLEDLKCLFDGMIGQRSRAQQLVRQQWFDTLSDSLGAFAENRFAHPIHNKLFESVRTRDADNYRIHWNEYKRLTEQQIEFKEQTQVIDKLKSACPKLLLDLQSNCREEIWETQVSHWAKAWEWKLTSQWFSSIADPRLIEPYFSKLQSLHKSQLETTEGLAANMAWQAVFKRMTETERQHLIAWEKAIKRVGKGTGKHSAQHGDEAREHMKHCRGAIPAWIMPLHRVVGSMRPGEDRFDVAIVDEASQSGPEALFLFDIADKIVIVGDDKQIAPDPIGTSIEAVDKLRTRYLQNIDCRDAIGVGNSLFDFAEIRLGGRIRLREHFRCMPEIIEFSNRLCYQGEPLIPLRQYGENRLEPPVVSVHVPNGKQKGTSSGATNIIEADAIVNTIKNCLKDPRYKNKTFGVISLLGETQAKCINRKLINEVGPEQIEKREIVCGDAYAFQGDERDVIFLSMVSAPGPDHRISNLSDLKSERRFNVAVSRARDQVFLFHSISEKDLRPGLRLKLLTYFKNPRLPEYGTSFEISKSETALNLRHLSPPAPFTSWLEVDIYTCVKEKNFSIIPQFSVGDFNIDLVVSGGASRLGILCDSDRNLTNVQINDRSLKQRDLEKMGWSFWHIQSAWFQRNPEKALLQLWQRLAEVGIRPETSHKGESKKAA